MHLRRLLLSALAVTGLTLLPGTAQAALAAPSDVPTEEAERVVETVPVGDYDELESQRCRYEAVGDGLDVACRGGGTFWLEYEVEVPAAAINLRSSLVRTFAEDSRGRYALVDVVRSGRTTRVVTVSVARGTEVRLDEVRLRYDLPTQVDDRACVTPGEWQAVNVAKGGTGGTRKRVAAVFDHAGVLEERSAWRDGYRYEVRAYPRCDSARKVRISFHRYRDQPGWHSYWG
ncbi:hypothetical protein [Nocardioides solisilvae]|uniref:hypothetical protein n=1 Tax=Nocardioides solisilvae TaxID=1542435 RepID=UPI000D745C33|nr:hypothetical protein [Nocardioides solisilvae]